MSVYFSTLRLMAIYLLVLLLSGKSISIEMLSATFATWYHNKRILSVMVFAKARNWPTNEFLL